MTGRESSHRLVFRAAEANRKVSVRCKRGLLRFRKKIGFQRCARFFFLQNSSHSVCSRSLFARHPPLPIHELHLSAVKSCFSARALTAFFALVTTMFKFRVLVSQKSPRVYFVKPDDVSSDCQATDVNTTVLSGVGAGFRAVRWIRVRKITLAVFLTRTG